MANIVEIFIKYNLHEDEEGRKRKQTEEDFTKNTELGAMRNIKAYFEKKKIIHKA